MSGFLVYALNTSNVEPADGTAITSPPRYHREHPKDTYGDALIVPCEFFSDARTERKAHLPADGQPQ